jgi:hypothetical protein
MSQQHSLAGLLPVWHPQLHIGLGARLLEKVVPEGRHQISNLQPGFT